ncbi:MAG: glycosyltransferase [Clostridia bacterium]|nr:glycosyltransferase [Clostridia bacterium]
MINHAGKAGTEKYVLRLINGFDSVRAKCFLCYGENGPLADELREKGTPTFCVNMKNPFDKKAARQIADICRSNNIDVIHTQYPREMCLAVLSKKYFGGPKVVYTCHLTLRASWWWRIMYRRVTPKTHAIISVCNKGKELLKGNGAAEEKIRVVFNGIVPSAPKRSSVIRTELGIGNEVFVITTLARYHMAKGLDFLTDSVARLKEITTLPFVVLYVGDGELFGEIKERIEKKRLSDVIKQLGFRTDAQQILAESDLFVNSAKCYEALSFAILEAMDNSLPIVATDVGGNSDIVSEQNDCGILVPYGDVDAMARAMARIMEDSGLRARYSKNARRTLVEVFGEDKMLDETYKTYL